MKVGSYFFNDEPAALLSFSLSLFVTHFLRKIQTDHPLHFLAHLFRYKRKSNICSM